MILQICFKSFGYLKHDLMIKEIKQKWKGKGSEQKKEEEKKRPTGQAQ